MKGFMTSVYVGLFNIHNFLIIRLPSSPAVVLKFRWGTIYDSPTSDTCGRKKEFQEVSTQVNINNF